MKLHILLLQALILVSGFICAADQSAPKADGLPWLTAFQSALETNNISEKNKYLAQVLQDKDLSLSIASFRGSIQTVEFLLSLKGVNLSGIRGISPLICAANKGHVGVVKLLLEKKVSPDTVDGEGATALHMAVDCKSEAIVALLLDAGANPSIKNNSGITPLHIAAHAGYLPALQALLAAGAPVDATSVSGLTPLCMAVNADEIDCVDVLLKAGAKRDVSAPGIITPLIRAARKGYIGCAELLLKAGASIDLVDYMNGATALIIAAQYGREGIVKLLLAGGANVNAVKKEGVTALALAIIAGYPAVAQLLLEAGADIMACTESGHSVLYMLATSQADAQGMKSLCALLENKKDLLSSLDVADCIGDYPIHHAALSNNADAVDFLLNCGSDINVRNRYGETPVYVAAREGNLEACMLLCKRGADLALKIYLGLTPLDIAQTNGHKHIAACIKRFQKKEFAVRADRHISVAEPSSASVLSDSDESEEEAVVVSSSTHSTAAASSIGAKPSGAVKKHQQKRIIFDTKALFNDDIVCDCAEYVALRQRDQNMTLIIYKEQKQIQVPRVVIKDVSQKQDKFHRFSDVADNNLKYGIRIDCRNQAQHREMLNDLGIHALTRGQSAIVLPGKIERKYYDHHYAIGDKNQQTQGYSGAFVYLFNADGTCYHRCFHQNKLSKQQHSFEAMEMN